MLIQNHFCLDKKELVRRALNQGITYIHGGLLIFMPITASMLETIQSFILQEVGTGTVLDILLVSSGPCRYQLLCPTCTPPEEANGVVSSCFNCFLAGGILYRSEYAVSRALFITKVRGGTCTLEASDPDDLVLENGFGCYNVFNNCEDFTIYCKTGLLVLVQSTIGNSGQAVSTIGGLLSAVLSSPLWLATTNFYGLAAIAAGFYCAGRYAADAGTRRDAVKISVEDLTTRLASAPAR